MDDIKIRLALDGAEQVQAGATKAAAGMDKLGAASAKAGQQASLSAQQMQQVGYQLNDFFVQIQAGQSPLTAFVQQGSQLSGTFGGFGNAARAVASLVSPTMAALGGLAAVVGVTALAYNQGAEEAKAYGRALVLSGNAAGVTVGQLRAMAQAQAAVVSTQGAAAQALAALAGTGQVTASSLAAASEAATRLAAVGVPLEDMVKKFAALGKDPLKALTGLNEAENFLTESVYRQVKALTDQGRVAEAAAVAQNEYARVGIERSKALQSQLGYLESAWIGVGSVAKSAWDKMLNVGRSDNVNSTAIQALRARIEANNFDASQGGQTAIEAAQRGNAILTARLRLLEQGAAYEAQSAAYQAQYAAQVKASTKFDEEGEKYLAKKLLIEREIEQTRKLGLAAGRSQKEIEDRILAIREKLAEQTTARGGDPFAADREAAKEWAKYMAAFGNAAADAEGKTASLTHSQVTLVEFLQSAGYRQMPETARELALQQAYAAIAGEQLNIAMAKTDKIAADAARSYATWSAELRKGGDQVDQQVQRLRDEEAATLLMSRGYSSLAVAIQEVEIARLRERQVGLLGDESAVLAIQREIDKRRELMGLLASKDEREASAKAAKQAAEDWRRAADKINDSLTDALLRGFESGKSFARNLRDTVVNMFKTMILRPVISAIVNPIGGAIAGSLGLSGAANAASGIGLAAGVGGSIFGAGGLAGALAGGAGWLTGSTTLGGALSAGASLVGTGTAAGAASGLGMIAGALGPIVLGIGAIASLAKALDHSGTPHIGGSSAYNSIGGLTLGEGLNGVGSRLGDYSAKTEAFTTGLVQSIVGILDSTAASFGKTAGYTAAAAFADDSSKDGAWGALAIKLGDQMVASFGAEGNGRWPGRGFADGEAGSKQYLDAVSADVRNALNAIGLPDWATKMLDQLGTAPSLEQLATVVAQINATESALSSLGKVMPQLANLTGDAVTSLLQAMGGIEGLGQAASSYYENFYTETEKQARATEQLSAAFSALGFAVPTSREAFRALVQQQDPNTAAGLASYAGLLKLNQAFAALVPATEALADSADQTAADVARAAEQMAEAGRRALAELAGDQGSLQVELLRAQGQTEQAAALERQQALAKLTQGLSAQDAAAAAAAYDFNAALREQIAVLNDASASAANAAAAEADRQRTIASERAGIQARIDELLGNTSAIRARELATLDETNRALQERYYALVDERTAAEAATQATQALADKQRAIANERGGIQARIDDLLGNTSAIRARELATLDETNRALQERFYALVDEQAAQRAATQAAEESARAAEQLRDAWRSIGDTLLEEAQRILGLSVTSDANSLAQAQSRFAITTAQARAGDQDAAKLLPQLGRTVVELTEQRATSLAELDRIRAQVAGSLQGTAGVLGGMFGFSVPAAGGNGVPALLAQIAATAPITGAGAAALQQQSSIAAQDNLAALVQEVKSLRAEVAQLKDPATRTAAATERTRDLLIQVTDNGQAMQTEAAQ